MRKRFKVIPDAISKSGKNKGRTTPTGRTSGTKKHLFVEDVLQDIGKCCGVDYCTGTISHSIVPGKVAIWGIQSGSFGQIEVKSITTKSKWKLNEQAIYRKEPGNPTGRLALPFVESVLTELSHCCGSNCHCGYFRLPNWEEKKIYEWGTDESGSVYGPVEVADIPDSARQGIKKKWKIDPNSIYRRKSKHRTGSPRLRGRVEYFEDLLQEMVDSGYVGFDCCEGRLILPDTAVSGTFYEVRIVSGSFQLTEIQDCGVTPPPPAAGTAPTFEDATSSTAAIASSMTINMPAIRPDGDLYVLYVYVWNTGNTPVTITPPAGWTEVVNETATFSSYTYTLLTMSRIGSSEPATYTLGLTDLNNPISDVPIDVLRYSGNAPAIAGAASASPAADCPAVTANRTNVLVLRSGGAGGADAALGTVRDTYVPDTYAVYEETSINTDNEVPAVTYKATGFRLTATVAITGGPQ